MADNSFTQASFWREPLQNVTDVDICDAGEIEEQKLQENELISTDNKDEKLVRKEDEKAVKADLHREVEEEAQTFYQASFWREPVPDVDVGLLL